MSFASLLDQLYNLYFVADLFISTLYYHAPTHQYVFTWTTKRWVQLAVISCQSSAWACGLKLNPHFPWPPKTLRLLGNLQILKALSRLRNLCNSTYQQCQDKNNLQLVDVIFQTWTTFCLLCWDRTWISPIYYDFPTLIESALIIQFNKKI